MNTEALLAVLKQEKEMVTKLITKTRQEREAMAGQNLTWLQEILEEKARAKLVLKNLEEERLAITGGKRLTQLMDLLPEEAKDELCSLSKELKGKARELKYLNDTNILLAKSGLAYIKKIQENLNTRSKLNPYGRDACLNTDIRIYLMNSYA